MNPDRRRLHRVVVGLLVAGTVVSMRGSADWASAGALGDVAVAFDNQVQLFANADGALKETIDIDELTGTNTGLAFDAALNLLVTNTDGQGNGRLVTLASVDPHGSVGTPISTSAPPRSLAIAADGTIYVASRRRHDPPVHQDRNALSDVQHRNRFHGMHRHRPQPRSEHAVRGVRWQKDPNDNRSGEARRSRAGRNLQGAAKSRHGMWAATAGAG